MERQIMIDGPKAKLTPIVRLFVLLILFTAAPLSPGFCATTSMRFLYPSFSGTWATPWIAKEAGYFAAEGLDVELVRVGGSTRIVAALLGGSAPFVSAGGSAAIAASTAGSDVVIIAAAFNVSAFHLMARPEIKQPSDLKGKKAGISAFGSSSDLLVRLALKKYGLEPGKDVAILPMGGQPEAFAALQNGSIHLAGLTFPLYLTAAKAGMSEPIKVSDVGFEDVTGTVITTRSFLSQQRDTTLRFLRAFIRGIHRYKTDREFTKRVFAKYGKITDDYLLEGTWQEHAQILQRVPRPSLKGLQFLIEAQYKDKSPMPKPESFVDNSLVDQLERSGFVDALYKQ
jgi:NitT/TauT family transport system substrate-binding protein